MDNKKKKFDFKTFAVLHFILLLYSFVGVFMKLAFQNEMFSFNFFLFAGLAVLFLGSVQIFFIGFLGEYILSINHNLAAGAQKNAPYRGVYQQSNLHCVGYAVGSAVFGRPDYLVQNSRLADCIPGRGIGGVEQ